MRLTFTFPARVTDAESNTDVPPPSSLDGMRATDCNLDTYFDSEIADAGVVGGEIKVSTKEREATVKVSYWLLEVPTDELYEALREYTIGQLDDGIGEGGFELVANGQRLVVTADTAARGGAEITSDGRIVASPPGIAIAARNGDLGALAKAIEAKRGDIERLHQGCTALHLAILYGHSNAVRILLAAGADANRLDQQRMTPLELCAVSNSMDDDQSSDVAHMLLAAGCDPTHVSPTGESAKSYAACRGKRRMAEIIP